MCGIIGLVKYKNSNNLPKFEESAELLRHRGPDNFGILKKANVELAVHRLKIHDLSDKANQPYSTRKSDIWLCFNGAITNFRRLSAKLGFKLSTNSDTEVLIEAYLKWGTNFLKYLEGMYAIAIYDSKRQTILLARDHTGIKPLYFHFSSSYFMFSSEVKPILKNKNFVRKVNTEIILEYFSRGFVVAPNTMFSGIRQLEPGSFILINTKTFSEPKISYYWKASDQISQVKSSIDKEEFENILKDIVADNMQADVDVGIQLSGGIDSGLISNYVRTLSDKKINTYSVIFDDMKRTLWKPRSEESQIDYITNKFGFNSSKYIFSDEDIKNAFKQAILSHEHPLYGASTALFYLLARNASHKTKVLLSGEGMDDIFLGYYQKPKNCMPRGDFGFEIPQEIIGRLSKKSQLNPSYIDSNSYISELRKSGVSNLDICSLLDLKYRLPGLLARNERSMMAHSIESRPPFCNHKLIEMRFKIKSEDVIADNIAKACVKNLALSHFPFDFVYRDKIGFSSPYGDFLLKKEIWGSFLNNLNFDLLEAFVDVRLIKEIYRLDNPFEKLTGNNLKVLFYAINFQAWHEIFFN